MLPLYNVLADIIHNKNVKRILFGTISAILIFGAISSSLLLSSEHFYSFTNYVKENDIKFTVYTDVLEEDEKEECNNYEQAWMSYKIRLEIPDDNYINFKEEQTERYYGNNTVQISDRVLITKNENDINNDTYLFTLSEKEFKNRTLIKTYKNYGAHCDTWYLYSPVNKNIN